MANYKDKKPFENSSASSWNSLHKSSNAEDLEDQSQMITTLEEIQTDDEKLYQFAHKLWVKDSLDFYCF